MEKEKEKRMDRDQSQNISNNEFRSMLDELRHFKNNKVEYADALNIPTLKNYTPTAVNMFTGERQRIQFYNFKPTFRGRYYTSKRVVIPLDGYLYRDYERMGIQTYAMVSRLFFVLVHTDSDILLVTVPIKPHMDKNGSLMFILSGRLVILMKFDDYSVVESQVDDNYFSEDGDSGYSSDDN